MDKPHINLIQKTHHNSNFKGSHHLLFNGRPNSKYIPQLKLQGDSSPSFNGIHYDSWVTSKWQKTSKPVGVKSPRIPKKFIMNPTMLYVHYFHIQALIEEFSTKKILLKHLSNVTSHVQIKNHLDYFLSSNG